MEEGTFVANRPDQIHIVNLRLRGMIGVADWEKKARQDIVINLTIRHNQSAAGQSDDVADTVDYRAIRDRIVAYVESTPHELLESLAQHLATMVLEDPRVHGVTVRVEKPGALRFADSVAIEIDRNR